MRGRIMVNPPTCPNEDCGNILDAYTGIDLVSVTPDVGDVTICVGCGWVLEFNDDLQLDVFQITDFMKLPAHTQADITKAQHWVTSEIERKVVH